MRMPFGKHAGIEVSEVPRPYLEWLSKEGIRNGALKAEVEAVLAKPPPPPDPEKKARDWAEAEAVNGRAARAEMDDFAKALQVVGEEQEAILRALSVPGLEKAKAALVKMMRWE